MIKAIAPELASEKLPINVSLERVKRVCSEFESIFLSYMLKTMRETIPEGGLLGKDYGDKIIKSMLDEKLAIQMARGGGIGLGKMLLEKLRFTL